MHINRHELDLASERLSAELKKLDRHVSTAVIDHITTVFADAELPVHNMIQAATASLLVRLTFSFANALFKLWGYTCPGYLIHSRKTVCDNRN